MATQLQLRRGTEAENDAFTGAQGEVTVDTTNNQLRVHDGTTSGGYKVANIGDEASKDLDNLTATGKANISTLGTYDENETYASGTVGAELAKIAGKADAGTTLAGYGITDGANTDLSNLTSTGKENISKLGTYDSGETYSAGTVGAAIADRVRYCSYNMNTRVQISTTSQTAAKNGWLVGFIAFSGSNKDVEVYINNANIAIVGWSNGEQWFTAPICLPLKAGQTYYFACTGLVESNQLFFYPDD